MQCVIHPQPVVSQFLLEDCKIALLLKEAFEDERQLRGRAIQGVVVMGFVHLSALFIAEGLFAEVGNSTVNVEFDSCKIVQVARKLESLRSHCVAHLERLRIRILT